MSYEFVHFPDLAEPLTVDRNLQSCQVAGLTLKNWQESFLEPLNALETVYFCRSTSWLTPKAVQRLVLGEKYLTDQNGVVLIATDKETLANNKAKPNGETDSFEIKYAWDLLKINETLISGISQNVIIGSVHPNAVVEGIIHVGAGTKILPGVFIEGNVIIGANSKIGPNCYIRGNTFIGDNCHIGQSVEIKNCLIMDKTNVGHLSYVGDSILGVKVNFGAGTTVSNLRHDNGNHRSVIQGELIDTGRRKFGVIIGDGVHTGINTSFYPGRKIWPKMTTLPGEVVSKEKK